MFAIIDLETTGGSAVRDKITEVAIVLHDGKRKVREFSTLVNPECPIPNYITDITGIDDAMVANAPKFYEIAREIVELTQNCVFVAHNVNFDYGFLREEFRRLAYEYNRETLCTVRTSRKLIPGLRSYSLGKLCATLGITIEARHRAMGDAAATVILFEKLLAIDPNLGGKHRQKARDPWLGIPPSVDRESLRNLPEGAGLYFFHDEHGEILHADTSSNIRRTVLKQLRALNQKRKKSQTFSASAITEVTCELTGSELLARLQLPGALKQHAAENLIRGGRRRYKAGV
ncbi:MAG: exonuclease domain-containing protein, partial [Bacteroidota bacterium]